MLFGVRAKLRQRCQALLEPGEVIEWVFPAIVGHHTTTRVPAGMRVVAVTDRNIVVIDNEGRRARPTRVLRRLPRQTRLGPFSWKNNFCDTLGEELTIDSRWFKDARAADEAAGWFDD